MSEVARDVPVFPLVFCLIIRLMAWHDMRLRLRVLGVLLLVCAGSVLVAFIFNDQLTGSVLARWLFTLVFTLLYLGAWQCGMWWTGRSKRSSPGENREGRQHLCSRD